MLLTTYETLKSVKELGFSYDSIHTWTNGCVFFHGTLKDSRVCQKCNTNRFVDKSSYVPRKVFQHFLLIPRLLQLYKWKTLAKLLIWHKHGANINDLIWSVPNLKSWKHIDEKWQQISIKTQNIILQLALNGVNAFGDLSSCLFTWLLFLLNYNLPPWLVMKCYFLVMVLIILGKESITNGNVKTCVFGVSYCEITNVVEMCSNLWCIPMGDILLNLVMCMWNIHNFLAYGLFARCVTKGLVVWLPFAPTTKSQSCKKFKKDVYCGSFCYLLRNHFY